jgi:hypothetical protein
MLSVFGETVLWYAAAFTVVMALAGAALAAAARSRGRTLPQLFFLFSVYHTSMVTLASRPSATTVSV